MKSAKFHPPEISFSLRLRTCYCQRNWLDRFEFLHNDIEKDDLMYAKYTQTMVPVHT